MTINNAIREYGLPERSTMENLEFDNWKVLSFGSKVLLAGYYYNYGKACEYYAAIYSHIDNDLSCEGEIELTAVSDVEFVDDGHAIAWALAQCSANE